MDDLTGWWLDEYDGPRFQKFISRHGGRPHESDPLATAEGDCWKWLGKLDPKGYGRFAMGRKMIPAHRVAYLDGGRGNRIPEGYVLDHLCRNPACVNPLHLEPVPHAVNVARGARGRAARPTCPSGHEFTPDNTKMGRANGREHRICRTCEAASKHRIYLRLKEQRQAVNA